MSPQKRIEHYDGKEDMMFIFDKYKIVVENVAGCTNCIKCKELAQLALKLLDQTPSLQSS